jgi:hypothetical protein
MYASSACEENAQDQTFVCVVHCKYQKKVRWDIPDACLLAQGHKVMKQFQVGNSVW